WGTYVGGSGYDKFYVAGTFNDKVFGGGETNTTGMATGGAYQQAIAGLGDDYAICFDTSGSRLWCTYFGGPDAEDVYALATDRFGNMFLQGTTKSTSGIASPGAHQT